MKKMKSHLACLYCLCLTLAAFSLFPRQAAALCPIDKNGTYIEAEHFSGSYNIGSITVDNRFYEVSETDASGGMVLVSGTGASGGTAPKDEVKEYTVNFPEAGTYRFWMRGKGLSDKQDSMFFTVDNMAWKAWNFGGVYNKYIWTGSMEIGADNTMVVSAGKHTIKIAMREKGTRIDGFYITTGDETPDWATPPATVSAINPNAGCAGPKWAASPVSFEATGFQGYNAPSMSFSLKNIGDNDTKTATVKSNLPWAEVTPNIIPVLKYGDSQTVTVDFNTADLAIGTYSAELTVTGSASNAPLKIPVALRVKEVPPAAACGQVPLYVQNLVSPAVMVLLDTSESMVYSPIYYATKINQSTPELKDLVQGIVKREDWEANNALAFRISLSSGSGKRSAWSRDGRTNLGAPKLILKYQIGSGPETLRERIVSSSDNDGQLSNSTTVDLTATALDLGRSNAPVGLRFVDIGVPKGATIISATISFSAYAADREDKLQLAVQAVDQGNVPDLSFLLSEAPLTSTVLWDPDTWEQGQSRRNFAAGIIQEAFLDRHISWGFAHFTNDPSQEQFNYGECSQWAWCMYPSPYFTYFAVSVHAHDDNHQTRLQNAVQKLKNDGRTGRSSVLGCALSGGAEYFHSRDMADRGPSAYNKGYIKIDCQPRIVVVVTDGTGVDQGAGTGHVVKYFADRKVSLVVVGVGPDSLIKEKLSNLAKNIQIKAKESPDDSLYPLHKENDKGEGIPYSIQNEQEFLGAMNSIGSNIKAQMYHGSSPATTTSTDNGELLLNSSFNGSDWSGEMTARKFNAYTGEIAKEVLWNTKDKMPTDINGFMYNESAGKVSQYTEGSLKGDKFLCKPMGDIINSTPAIVGRPPYFYNFDAYSSFRYDHDVRARDALVYVGANDGALHAFKLADGVEKWRFYPESVKDKMKLAETSPSDDMCSKMYCHKYLLDGSPQPADIYASGGWHTILTTGLGEGGRAYFALDVTYGNDFDATENPSKYLWEFTSKDDDKIGLATSIPTTIMVADNTNKNDAKTGWATFFGSGKEESDISQSTKEAYIFAVNSFNKDQIWKDKDGVLPVYKIKLSTTALPNDIPAPLLLVETKTKYVADRMYLGNSYGNMYRVQNIGFGDSPSSSILYDNSDKKDRSTPVSAKAEYATVGNKEGDVWIYFGTGKYSDQMDKFSSDQQYFHGLLDKGDASSKYIPGNLAQISTQIIEAYALDKNGNKVDLDKDGNTNDDKDDLVKYRTISCGNNQAGDGSCNPDKSSWRLQLAKPSKGGSERVISQPLVVGGIVFFTTFVPNDDVCAAGSGETWLFALDWKSGEFVTDAVFDINRDGRFDTHDKTVKDKSGTIHGVAGIYIGTGMPSGRLAMHNDILFVGTTETTKSVKVNLPEMMTKLRSWQQVSQ